MKITNKENTKKEPTHDEVLKNTNVNKDYYAAREELRERAYGGKPPNGFQSWGDYWKSY